MGKKFAKPPLRHSHEMQNSANRGLSPPPIIPNKLIIHRPLCNGILMYLKDHSYIHEPDIYEDYQEIPENVVQKQLHEAWFHLHLLVFPLPV
jgi:hypothetical protein